MIICTGTLIDLGLEDELLEHGGPDLVQFLQNAGRDSMHEVCLYFLLTQKYIVSPICLGFMIFFFIDSGYLFYRLGLQRVSEYLCRLIR